MDPLCQAIQRDDRERVDALLREGADPDAHDRSGQPALMVAVSNLPMVTLLLERGADPNAANTAGWSCANAAAGRDRPDVLAALAAAGADLERQCSGLTPLHCAASGGCFQSISWLLEQGVSIDPCGKEGKTPLHVAGAHSRGAAISLLLQRGADPDARDDRDRRPAECAVGEKAPAIRRLFGAAVPANRRLLDAALLGDLDALDAAMAAGAKIGERGGTLEQSALTIAVERGDKTFCARLLELGADINEAGPSGGAPLRMAIEQRRAMLPWLCERGARFDVHDKHHNYPFCNLTHAAVVSTLEQVISLGADVNAQHQFLRPLLSKSQDPVILRLLLANGADLRIRDKDGMTPLHCAVLWDREEATALLLGAGADIEATDNNGQTPLHHVGFRGSLGVLPLLLAAGADHSATDDEGKTPFDLATSRGHVVMAEQLQRTAPIEKDPVLQAAYWQAFLPERRTPQSQAQFLAILKDPRLVVDDRNEEQQTTLQVACRHHWMADFVAPLLDAGADVNALDKDGMSPLLLAAKTQGCGTEMKLLRAGADPQHTTWFGANVLHLSAASDRSELIPELLRWGMDVDKLDNQGRTPLAHTMYFDKMEAARALLDGGASVDARGDSGPSPLLIAAERGNEASIRWLLAAGADPNQRHEALGLKGSPLYIAIAEGRLGIADALRKGGADLDLPDTSGAPILLKAASCRMNLRAVRWFIEHGADVARASRRGVTALHEAARADQNGPALIELLVAAGVHPGVADNEGKTPIFYTIGWSCGDNLRKLLALGADVNALDNDGNTALHACVGWRPWIGGARILIAAGVDVTRRNSHGKTFADLARESERPELVALV